MRPLRLGTRGSLLARAQSELIAAALGRLEPGREVELVAITTRGDRDLTTPLDGVADPDFFSSELDEALLAGTVDLCVHSLKDLPARRPAGLSLAALPARENPRDCILFRADTPARLEADQPLRIGTSSIRRARNLQDFLPRALPATGRPPQLAFRPVRGAVDQRLTRLSLPPEAPGALDGLVLALAGLNRLWNAPAAQPVLAPLLAGMRWMVLPLEHCPAAPGQGMLALECRSRDLELRELLARLHDPGTARLRALEQQALDGLPPADRPLAGVTTLVHDTLGPLCYLRGPMAGGSGVHQSLHWTSPPPPAGSVVGWDGIEWQRACSRRPLPVSLALPAGAPVFAAYWHAATDLALPADVRLWVSGVESWRRLAARGYWVEGCGDNLGFAALVPTLAAPVLGLPPLADWTALTSAWAAPGWEDSGLGRVLATYAIEPPDAPTTAGLARAAARATYCYWSSPEQFRALGGATAADAHHACGAGKTLATLRAAGVAAVPFPNGREWHRWLH